MTLTAAIAALGLASLLPSQALAQKTLNFATVGVAADEDTDAMMVFEEYVESRTNGEIQVELFTDGAYCGSMRECLESVQNGTLEATITTGGGLGNLFPAAQVFDVPYMMRDDRVAECVFGGDFFDEFRKAFHEAVPTVRLMTAANSAGWRNFATTNKQIKAPSDVAGVKFRTIPSPIQQELVRTLGGNPTPVAWPEVYSALATGVVEGTKNGLGDIVNNNFTDNIKYVILDGHTYGAGFWFMNDAFWQDLTPEQKQIVNDAYYHLRTVGMAVPKRRNIDAIQKLREAGVEIYLPSPAEKKAFQEAAKPVQDWFVEQQGDRWLNGLREAVATCEAEIDASIMD
ncbi:TRAP transporter substrate-binding protein DctP [Rhodobacteraceae bacterium NNCM2]|nr:TRAP transporter substrate-binding protein DctP [Coraliihabitans acroporae]